MKLVSLLVNTEGCNNKKKKAEQVQECNVITVLSGSFHSVEDFLS